VECQTIAGSYRRPRAAQPEQQIQRAVFEHLAIRAASTVFAFHPASSPGWRHGAWCVVRAKDAAPRRPRATVV
jgi:hypothetical protein